MKEVADEIGVGLEALNRWELSEREPRLEIVVRLADAFGVTVDSLLRTTAAGRSPAEQGT